jgi:hypothetical protein
VPAGSAFHSTSYDSTTTTDQVVWLGTNDVYNGVSGGASGPWQAPLLANLQKIVARSTGRSIIIGLLPNYQDTTWRPLQQAWNAQAKSAFGASFLDLTPYLTSTAALTDLGLTPTTQDAADIAAGWIPQTLRGTDTVHLSQTGYQAVTNAIEAKLQSLGWITAAGAGTGGGGTGTPTPPPAQYTVPWTVGAWDQDLPSSLRVVNYTDLYALLTASEKAAETRVVTALGKLPSFLASKGWGSYAAVQFPSGFDEVIPGFTLGSKPNWIGLYSSALVGLLGGVSNGQIQARLSMKAAAMTQEQLDYVAGLSLTGSSGSGYTTNQLAAVRFASGQSIYVAGMQLDGNDQQVVKDYVETGPAAWGGLALYKPGPNSMIQNTLLRGFGHATSTSPPGEVGMVAWTRDVSSLVRRVEFDGRTPAGDRRGGGFMYSASDSPEVVDAWLHDTYTSGMTWSFAGSIGPGNYSHDYSSTRLRSENNANHKGYSSGYRFDAINQEEPHGSVVHNAPMLGLDVSTNPYWDSAHMSYSNQQVPSGDTAATIVVNDPVVLDAATGGAYSKDNGCFSIKTNPFSRSTGIQVPIVTQGGVQLQPWIRTGAGSPPSYVTPDTHFIWKQQN